MSPDCQFPGCGNPAGATYCEECRQRVRGPRSSAELDPISLAVFLAALVLTFLLLISVLVVVGVL